MGKQKDRLPKKSEDISKWYLAVLEMANIIDYGPAKGTMVIMPYGYALWERTQELFNTWFKKDGVQNAYFPLFIPASLLEKEKKHIEGFSPELAVVTHGGGKELAEPLVVRPTSETIMYEMFKDWISSYKDLPLKINQWANVVRWELRTFPFLRTTEFLWQEGHTVHKTEEDAMDMVLKALEWYKRMFEEYYGIALYVGEKSGKERFAGAARTFSIELVMPDGKALQAATSHYLGQNFSKAFKVKFSDVDNKQKYGYQTSWGFSTRALGGLILSHGDDNGLVLPPKMAPIRTIILPVFTKDEELNAKIKAYVRTVEDMLQKSDISYVIDDDINKTLGYRLNESEIQGIPIRLIIGGSEYDGKYVTMSRRDDGKKERANLKRLGEYIVATMDEMQIDMYEKTNKAKEDLTVEVDSFDEFSKIMEEDRKFIRAYWCESVTCEDKIKEKTKATTRVVEMERINDNEDGACLYCKNKARRKWLFAQAY